MILSASCQVALLLSKALQLYIFLMMAYALVSWVPSLRGRWVSYIARIIDPVLLPMRRVIPPIAGFDLSFLVLFLLVQWLSGAIVRFSCYLY
jgi:YggT family protein